MLKTGRLDALTVVLQCSGLVDVGQDWNLVGQFCITASDERIKQWQKRDIVYVKTRRGKKGEKGTAHDYHRRMRGAREVYGGAFQTPALDWGHTFEAARRRALLEFLPADLANI